MELKEMVVVEKYHALNLKESMKWNWKDMLLMSLSNGESALRIHEMELKVKEGVGEFEECLGG